MAERKPFPTDPDEFGNDARIGYLQENKTYMLEDENGEEWEWLPTVSKWSKTVDEELAKQQAEIYKVQGVDENEPALNPKKRKEAHLDDPEANPKGSKAKPATSASANADAKATTNAAAAAAGSASAANNAAPATAKPRQNKAIYVTGLPLDTDSDEIRDAFKKFGIIAESVDNNQKRIKMYNDEDGDFKGEALIVYNRPESVRMAIDIMDGAPFPRLNSTALSGPISVVEADSNFKAHKEDATATPQQQPKLDKKYKEKAKKKAQEMEARRTEWSDDEEPSEMRQTSSRWDKVVVVKHVFTPEDAQDPAELDDIKDDFLPEAEKYGHVSNLTFFDLEEDGIITIRFQNATSAAECVKGFHGRWFGQRQLEAAIATGDEQFKKSRRKATHESDAADEEKRLKEYSDYIEGKTGNGEIAGAKAANGDTHT